MFLVFDTLRHFAKSEATIFLENRINSSGTLSQKACGCQETKTVKFKHGFVCMCWFVFYLRVSVFVCKWLREIKNHCLQLVRPPLLVPAAVRKSNAPLFLLSAPVTTCGFLTRSFVMKCCDGLFRAPRYGDKMSETFKSFQHLNENHLIGLLNREEWLIELIMQTLNVTCLKQ